MPTTRGIGHDGSSLDRATATGTSIMANENSLPADFSLVLGGPLYQLFRRANLSGDALDLLQRRIVVISLIAWLPLAVLSLLGGRFLPGSAAVPFLLSAEVHIRYLVAVPLMIAAELVVHQRMRAVLQQFLARDLIPTAERARFDAAVASVGRLRNSVLAEVLIVVIVYGLGVLVLWRQYFALDANTWYASTGPEGLRLSPAGVWYGYVSLPIFQFLLVRWYFRMFIWARFLWQVSRIPLKLLPTHPDRVGGLGFLANTAFAFMPLAVAHGAVLTGMLADRILHLGAKLPEFKAEILLGLVFVQLLVFGPLCVFASQLARTKRAGLGEYGTLAARYVGEFDTKWLRGGAPAGEPLIGSADIQSLADLGNSFEIVKSMRIAPVTRDAVFQLAVATLLPLAPLLLTMMPWDELLRKLFGILF
ncbi:MAG TPA: hypothetical protein VFL07_06135 [Rudaea sp.]|nr:hypothetical protein [Rudaea sp.]